MKKIIFISLVLLSANLYAAPAAPAVAPSIDIHALEKQLSNLQAQINDLKTTDHKTSEILAANKPLVQLDTADPYILMDKPVFAILPRPGFTYNLMKSKDQLNAPIIIGGIVQSDFQAWGGNKIPLASSIRGNSNYQQGSGLTFTNATIITTANIGRYATAIAFLTSDGRDYKVIVNRAALMLGNLNDFPFYFTIGRAFLPWGLFPGNGFLQNPVSTNTFRSLPIGQAVLSYADHGFNIDAGFYQYNNVRLYNYSNGTTTSSENGSMTLANYFGNIRYNNKAGDFNYSLSTGYLSDIRQTMSFLGFMYNTPMGGPKAAFTGGENPAIDFNGTLTYKDKITFFSEYTQTLNSAQYYGQDTGRFASWVLGLAITPSVTLFNHTMATYLQANYSGTKNMKNVSQFLLGDVTQEPFSKNMGVQHQAMTELTFEIFHDIYVGPEFQYQWLYNGMQTWVTSLDVAAVF